MKQESLRNAHARAPPREQENRTWFGLRTFFFASFTNSLLAAADASLFSFSLSHLSARIIMSARRKAQTGCVTLQSPRMTPEGLEVRGSIEGGAC